MSRENYDNYDQENLTYHAADNSAGDAINSETMEKKDPAINQHEDDSNKPNHRSDDEESKFSPNNTSENNDNDADFDNDANRRTLDESKAVEDEDEEE